MSRISICHFNHFTTKSWTGPKAMPLTLKRMREAVRLALVLASLVLLSFQLREVFQSFLDGKTNTAISYESVKKLLLPRITVCPRRPYRGEQPASRDERLSASHFEEDYVSSSWTLEDLYHPVSTISFKHKLFRDKIGFCRLTSTIPTPRPGR